MSDRIRAIAAVGATMSTRIIGNCDPQSPISVLMIHGTEDHGVRWDGDLDYVSVPETVEFWVKQNQCNVVPEHSQIPDIKADGTSVVYDMYPGCLEDSRIMLYSIIGGGHTWPGGSQMVQLWGVNGRISQNMDASQTIWDFFQELE